MVDTIMGIIPWFFAGVIGVSLLAAFFYGIVRYPKFLLLGAIALVAVGQFGRIPPGGGSGVVLLLDAILGLLSLLWLLWAIIMKRTIFRSKFHIVWLGFLAVSVVSLILSPLAISKFQLLFNGFYLLRLLFYSSLFWAVSDLVPDQKKAEKVVSCIIWTGITVIILGYIQLIIFPDIGILAKYGWDPHVGRFVSSFLDPNYLGGYLALILSLLLARSIQESKPFPWVLIFLLLIGAVLTYSRSGYLAILLVILAYGLRYSWKLMLMTALIAIPMALAIPRIRERVAGGFSVDKTARDRIDSWNKALAVTESYPITGVGYNNFRDAQESLGLLRFGDASHSGSGSDSSLLNIYATTGVAGITLFFLGAIMFLKECFRLIGSKERTPRASAALALVMASPALFIHAFFVNAWFYPFILVTVCALIGLVYSEKKSSE